MKQFPLHSTGMFYVRCASVVPIIVMNSVCDDDVSMRLVHSLWPDHGSYSWSSIFIQCPALKITVIIAEVTAHTARAR